MFFARAVKYEDIADKTRYAFTCCATHAIPRQPDKQFVSFQEDDYGKVSAVHAGARLTLLKLNLGSKLKEEHS